MGWYNPTLHSKKLYAPYYTTNKQGQLNHHVWSGFLYVYLDIFKKFKKIPETKSKIVVISENASL